MKKLQDKSLKKLNLHTPGVVLEVSVLEKIFILNKNTSRKTPFYDKKWF